MLRPGIAIRFRHLLVPLLLILSTAPTPSYGNDPGQECTASTARQISIAEASRRLKSLEHACVALTGVVDGWTIFQSLDDIYRNTQIWRNHDPANRAIARIGLRPFPDNLEPPSSAAGLQRVTLVGRLHDCSRDWGGGTDSNGDTIISMGTGWCHYNSGGVLTPVAIVARETVTITRKTGKQAWRQLGDIAPAKSNSALVAQARPAFDRLIDAAVHKDRQALLAIHGYDGIELSPDGTKLADDQEKDAQHILDLWFGHSDSVLSQVQTGARPRNIRFFEPRWKSDSWPEIWACWGPEPAAEDRWPISSLDAYNVAGRPYACVEMIREPHAMKPSSPTENVWVVQTYGGRTLLKEPAG